VLSILVLIGIALSLFSFITGGTGEQLSNLLGVRPARPLAKIGWST
jgi:hypothetical protein